MNTPDSSSRDIVCTPTRAYRLMAGTTPTLTFSLFLSFLDEYTPQVSPIPSIHQSSLLTRVGVAASISMLSPYPQRYPCPIIYPSSLSNMPRCVYPDQPARENRVNRLEGKGICPPQPSSARDKDKDRLSALSTTYTLSRL